MNLVRERKSLPLDYLTELCLWFCEFLRVESLDEYRCQDAEGIEIVWFANQFEFWAVGWLFIKFYQKLCF